MAKDADSKHAPTAAPFVPASRDLEVLAGAVQDCRGCRLWENSTQAVFGRGPADARLMLVGEQPGDVEDRKGEPFVGPAGGVLRRALEEAAISLDDVYLTNAVKHFSFTQAERGKRRLHKTPGTTEIVACRPWLEAELEAVRAPVVVALGAVAAKALFGTKVRVSNPQPPFPFEDRWAVATLHPSAVLRADDADRRARYKRLLSDLVAAKRQADEIGPRVGSAAGRGPASRRPKLRDPDQP
jgi:DNA polymerase